MKSGITSWPGWKTMPSGRSARRDERAEQRVDDVNDPERVFEFLHAVRDDCLRARAMRATCISAARNGDVAPASMPTGCSRKHVSITYAATASKAYRAKNFTTRNAAAARTAGRLGGTRPEVRLPARLPARTRGLRGAVQPVLDGPARTAIRHQRVDAPLDGPVGQAHQQAAAEHAQRAFTAGPGPRRRTSTTSARAAMARQARIAVALEPAQGRVARRPSVTASRPREPRSPSARR